MESNDILPPIVKKQPSRPKKAWKTDQSKLDRDATLISKKGVGMKCNLCKEYGHNRRTCKGKDKHQLKSNPKLMFM